MIDPRILAQIANPTGGQLGEMGKNYVTAKQNAQKLQMEREKLDVEKVLAGLKGDEAKYELAQNEARSVFGITSAYINEAKSNPALMTDPKAYNEYMMTLTEGLPENVVENFKGIMPTQIPALNRKSAFMVSAFDKDSSSLKDPKKITTVTRVDDKGNIYKRDDLYQNGDLLKQGKEYTSEEASTGEGSEFERHLRWFKKTKIPLEAGDDWYRENYAPDVAEEAILRKKRLGTRAGTEETLHQELGTKSRETENRRKIETNLRDEYTDFVKPYKTMEQNISGAIAAMDSGDTQLADTLMAQALSQVSESDVRAFAMYEKFDKTYGNVVKRTINAIDDWLTGGRTDAEKVEIRRNLEYMVKNYSAPNIDVQRNKYRAMAVEEGIDPFTVVPPESKEDIRDSTLIDEDRKLELLRLHNPNDFRK